MKILAFSDLHASHGRAIALVQASHEADLVIGAGDFCNMRTGLGDALALLSDISAPMVVVPGNAESADELRDAALSNMTILHGEAHEVSGLSLFGLGYGVPPTPFGEWSCDLSETIAADMLAPCSSADILITHSPPKGVADTTSGGLSVGSTAIHDAITRIQPQLAICGHIHDSWGRDGQIGTTRILNLGPTVNWLDF
ncbi:metallophosphoesterase family protein [Roseovarius sp. 2305UL8-3]|uniref:metallophosphoesterase family protein n=1 Tax=Roseovarius conchicola TaxID=3121636 RepID=UPI003527909B